MSLVVELYSSETNHGGAKTSPKPRSRPARVNVQIPSTVYDLACTARNGVLSARYRTHCLSFNRNQNPCSSVLHIERGDVARRSSDPNEKRNESVVKDLPWGGVSGRSVESTLSQVANFFCSGSTDSLHRSKQAVVDFMLSPPRGAVVLHYEEE